MQFALAIELFFVVFSILCFFISPEITKVADEKTVNFELKEIPEIEKTLSSIVLQLEQIEKSGFIKRIASLPKAHPEIETILGDALHYATELKLRTNQAISNQMESLECITSEGINFPAFKQDYSLWNDVTPGQVKQDYYVGVIEELNAIQARKTASLLKKKGIIDPSQKLSGKGIGRDRLIFLLQDHLPAHQQEVKQALQTVLKRELL